MRTTTTNPGIWAVPFDDGPIDVNGATLLQAGDRFLMWKPAPASPGERQRLVLVENAVSILRKQDGLK